MEKHRCRRWENIITILLGSKSQDVHQKKKRKEKATCASVLYFLRLFLVDVTSWKSRSGREKWGEIGHVFSSLLIIRQWRTFPGYHSFSIRVVNSQLTMKIMNVVSVVIYIFFYDHLIFWPFLLENKNVPNGRAMLLLVPMCPPPSQGVRFQHSTVSKFFPSTPEYTFTLCRFDDE